MKKEDINIWDMYRILHGEVPLEFYIELVLRSIFVYLLLAFSMRWMGKRMFAELSMSELAAMATLAAATGLVILAPERGLLPPLIVIGIVIVLKKAVHWLGRAHPEFEKLAEGKLSVLVKDGHLCLDEMKKTRISKEQLFAHLRQAEVIHLGTIKRMYLEANGSFSVIKNPGKTSGLPVIPEWDQDFIKEQHMAKENVCKHCGNLQWHQEEYCGVCRRTQWVNAIAEK